MVNLAKMVREAQRLQSEMAKAQGEVEKIERTFSVGGGAVQAVAKGSGTLKEVKIKPEVVDAKDVAMLEDMILTAVNGALEEVRKAAEERFSSVTSGMKLPGLPGLM